MACSHDYLKMPHQLIAVNLRQAQVSKTAPSTGINFFRYTEVTSSIRLAAFQTNGDAET
ncbi:hypothetical protein D1BOALGB6SA_3197 [Olavius sp. associated proteobacterium Delta 1]|nr:hypothetical protein D1BOALGB6SA_3197 [Olavius sp. associated proteobacterium Delta 1]